MAPLNTSATQITRSVDKAAGTVFRRVPPWTLGLWLLFVTGLFGAYFLRDSILAINSNAQQLAGIKAEIAHCHEMKMEMQKEINYLSEENALLKQRVSSLEQTVRERMP